MPSRMASSQRYGLDYPPRLPGPPCCAEFPATVPRDREPRQYALPQSPRAPRRAARCRKQWKERRRQILATGLQGRPDAETTRRVPLDVLNRPLEAQWPRLSLRQALFAPDRPQPQLDHLRPCGILEVEQLVDLGDRGSIAAERSRLGPLPAANPSKRQRFQV